MHEYEQGENTEQERKSVRQKLITSYETNISTRLKAELCSQDASKHNHAKDGSIRNVKSEQWCTSWWHQFKVLLLRGVRERRFEAFNRLRIFQVISVAVLAGLLWWHTPTSHIEDRVSIIYNHKSHTHVYLVQIIIYIYNRESKTI